MDTENGKQKTGNRRRQRKRKGKDYSHKIEWEGWFQLKYHWCMHLQQQQRLPKEQRR